MTVIGHPLVPAVAIPDEGLGPCMLALSPPMRAFVHFKAHLGFSNAKAARAAGYSRDKPDNAKVSGYALAHRGDVIVAIIEETRRVMSSEGPRSVRTLVEIRDDKKAENRDRLKAAVELLNRGGLNAVSEHHVTVEHLTDTQKDQRILALCRELGIADTEARKMLLAPEIIDAEYSEVPPGGPATPDDAERDAERDRQNDRRRQLRAASPEERGRLKAEANARRIAGQRAKYAAAQEAKERDNLSDLMGPSPIADSGELT
jgi:hypothetical protein